MSRVAVLTLLALAACAGGDTSVPRVSLSMNGWRADSGKPLTRVEFDALIASCRDRARAGSPAFLACLGDLGLKRAE